MPELSFIIYILIMLFIFKCIHVVPFGYEWVLEFLGKRKQETLKPGVHFIFPVVNRIKAKILMKEQVTEKKLLKFLTKDNVLITVEFVTFYMAIDAVRVAYFDSNWNEIILDLIQNEAPKIAETYIFDEILKSRSEFDEELRKKIDVVTQENGVRINRVEMVDFKISKDID